MRTALVILLSVLSVAAQTQSAPARLTFSKEFPGSDPDYYRVVLIEDGQAAYYVTPEDAGGVKFRLSPPLARQAFDLAARLNYFRGASLETRKKIAMMGKKTVVYESGGERTQAVFNYSENPDAMALAGLFDKISNTRQFAITLERSTRYDKLGLMKHLLLLESALGKGELAEPSLLIPILEQIAVNKSYMHIAQERAKIILGKIYDRK